MSHNLSGRMYRFLDVGMLLLGSLLGLASPSMAQQIPGAIPGSGSSVVSPSVTSPPTSAPTAPGRSAPGSTLSSSPAGIPSPSMPGSIPLIPSQPGTSQGITPGAFPAYTTSQPLPVLNVPESGDAATAPALPRQPVRNSRPSSDWWRGVHAIQMLSYANLAMTYLRVRQRHLPRSPTYLSVPITSSGQGII